MSLKNEQYHSLYRTREFLRDLFTVDKYPKTRKEMRARASSCLRHFPCLAENGEPIFSGDDFDCPNIARTNEMKE